MAQNKFENKKILVVEDDIYSCQLLNIYFSSTKAIVIIAKTAKEAVSKCKENSDINLVLMDIKLPGESGIYATKEIQKFNRNVPIIAQTASVLKQEIIGYKKYGIIDFIAKPYSKEDILNIASKYICR